MNRKQLTVFLVLLVTYAFCAFATYAFFADQLAATAGVPMPDLGVSNAVLGLANAGIVLVVYGIVGWVGFWFAPINGFGRLVHPQFPISIFASLSAGIGEEMLFR